MKYIFTCGGTAGHIYPALAVAGKLREWEPECEILFLGAEGKMETELVPREGYSIETLKITNISREHSLSGIIHNIDTAKNVAGSLHEAKKIMKKFRPDAVIGTGGYVCYPVLMAASKLKIPTLVHESNAVPGLTTRMLAKHVDKIMVGFEESRQYYSQPESVAVVGTPVRGEFGCYTKEEARRELGIPLDKKLVVSVWGSLGAGYMNEIMAQMIPMISCKRDYNYIHVTGAMYYEKFMEQLKDYSSGLDNGNIGLKEFIYDMPRVMAAADLFLCRAGASTISELNYMGKPAIMVPSPNVTNNHQEKNARVLEKAGGAKVLLEGEFDAKGLLALVDALIEDDSRLEEMSAAMRSLAVPDAADRMCEAILELARR